MADSEVNGAVGGNTPTTSKNALSKKSRKRRKKRGEGYAKKENPSESVDESLSKVNYNIKKNQERKRKIKLPTTQNKQGDDGMEKKKFVDESTDDDKGDDFGLVPERKSVTLPLPTLTLEQEVLHELHSIFPLVKKSAKHPEAIFVCNLCKYHCNNTTVVQNHISDRKHTAIWNESCIFYDLDSIPYPSRAQFFKLTDILTKEVEKHGLSEEDLSARQNIVNVLNKSLENIKEGLSVRMYGSSASGFGLKTSDVNIELCIPTDDNAAKDLSVTYKHILEQGSVYSDVIQDFDAEIPTVKFTDIQTNLQCTLTLSNGCSYRTAELLNKYVQIDVRVRILGVAFRLWAKNCNLDKPECGMFPPYAFAIMIVHFLQNCEFPVLPVLHQLVKSNENKPDIYLDPKDLEGKWETDNLMQVGELWVELFKFYACDYETPSRVVCLLKKLTRNDTMKRPGKRLTIKDPFLPRKTISLSGMNQVCMDYFRKCFHTSYKYFGVAQTETGPIYKKIVKEQMHPYYTYDKTMKAIDEKLGNYLKDHPYFQDDSTEISTTVSELETKLFNNVKYMRENNISDIIVTKAWAGKLTTSLNNTYLHFTFNQENFIGGQEFPQYCIVCQKTGHTKKTCEEINLPNFDSKLPMMTRQHREVLDSLCEDVLSRYQIPPHEEKMRKKIVSDIHSFLEAFHPTIQCQLFGSSCNGFGLISSDIDICVTFKESKTGKEFDFGKLIEGLLLLLAGYPDVYNLLPITTAKVPILKFNHRKTNLEGDISVYNTLGLTNTRMLYSYATCDRRAKMLGYMLKRFAKVCNIGDASRGSLSSYAYIIMLIYFLQNCDPPVLPVLQEIFEGETRPTVLFDKYDIYFYSDLSELRKIWPGHGKNTKTVGELWIEFLKFYCEFDYNRYVISIKQKERILKFEKLWNSKFLAIEDPFDVSHNLGTGLSRKMFTYIIKAFRRGYTHFGTPQSGINPQHLEYHFFSQEYLRVGEPPNDRGCRVCKKIGHVTKDCPFRRSMRKERQQKTNRPDVGLPRPPPPAPHILHTRNMPGQHLPTPSRMYNPQFRFPIPRPMTVPPMRPYGFSDLPQQGGNFFRGQHVFGLRGRLPFTTPPFKTAASSIDLQRKNGAATLPPFKSNQRKMASRNSERAPNDITSNLPVDGASGVDSPERIAQKLQGLKLQSDKMPSPKSVGPKLQKCQDTAQGSSLYSNRATSRKVTNFRPNAQHSMDTKKNT